jgi:hypothetical protein
MVFDALGFLALFYTHVKNLDETFYNHTYIILDKINFLKASIEPKCDSRMCQNLLPTYV